MLIELNEKEQKLLTVGMAIASAMSLMASTDLPPSMRNIAKLFIAEDAMPMFDKLMDSMTEEENKILSDKFPQVESV